jgi:exodeoxyribonuclease VII large subunit
MTIVSGFFNNNVFKVSEISSLLKRLVEENFCKVKIRGEVSGLKHSSKGHCYFNLKDDKAVINIVCWGNTLNKLAIKIEDGMEIICHGDITIYSGRSNYQLVANEIEIAGQGALLELLEKRKQKLAAEGLFDKARKKSLPFLPERIAVITSSKGSVINDIVHRIADRFPLEVLVWDVTVQGNNAANEIIFAINNLNNLPIGIGKPDLIILARGGGSIEDLWCFNDEELVRCIAGSALPIISAIGHETDFTLADMAADVRAPTPTAAAEIAVPVLKDLDERLKLIFSKLPRSLDLIYERARSKLVNFNHSLYKIENLLRLRMVTISQYKYKIDKFIQIYFERLRSNLCIMKQILERYDQVKILKMGFAIIRSDISANLITSVKQLEINREIEIQMHDGNFKAITKK